MPPRWALTAALLIGCTRVSEQNRFEAVDEQIAIRQTVPAAGATGVPVNAQIDLCWSNLVDPRSVGDVDAFITSGSSIVDTRVDVQLWPWRPPADATAPPTEAPWCSGSVLSVTPKAPLVEGTRYRLRLEDTAVGWAGESIDTDRAGWIDDNMDGRLYFLEFTTEDDPPEPDDTEDPEPDPTTLTDLFGPGQIFDPERAACSCHAGDDALAQARLDLSTPETAYADLVLATEVRDTGFPTITPRRPSDSFLLHKLLRDPDGTAIFGVRGDPMPPDPEPDPDAEEPPEPNLIPYADYVAIARWIEDGAFP